MATLRAKCVRRNILLVVVVLQMLFIAGCGGGDNGSDISGVKKVRSITVTDLGTLGTYSWAVAINGKGQVIGGTDTPYSEVRGFIWENGVMTDLGTLGGNITRAAAINERGQVTGLTFDASDNTRAFIWQEGVMTDLGAPEGLSSCESSKINNRGEVIGNCAEPSSALHAFLWQNGVMSDLGQGIAVDINDQGVVVVYSYLTGHSFIWQDGIKTDLGVVHADAVNSHGQVVGTMPSTALGGHAFLWDKGTITDLGPTPYGYPATYINNKGQVVISSDDSSGYIWQNGTTTDFGSLPGRGATIPGPINNRGQVVGYTLPLSPDGFNRAFVWENGVMAELKGIEGFDAVTRAADINDNGQAVGEAASGDGGPSGNRAVLWTIR